MHRIVIDTPGGYHVLRMVEAPDPEPGPGEIVIRSRACGVNYADSIIRMGLYASARTLHGYPITPGFEVAGHIAALGTGVTGFALGDPVIGLTLFNGYASHVRLPVGNVFPCPPGLDLAQAAGLPTVFLTAWFLVHRLAIPQPGDCWLVHSAAGGVGSALLQLARLADCRSVAVIGASHKREHALAMGADAIIDKSTRPLWPEAERLAPDGYQAIFDANGIATLAASYRHLAPTGKLLIYGFHSMLPRNGRLNLLRLARDWLLTPRFNPLRMTQENRSVLAANLSFLQTHADRLREGMHWLLERFSDGRLHALPIETFPLSHAARAQQRIESGQTIGKLVLIP